MPTQPPKGVSASDEALRTQYEQERALYNQYEREKAMVEQPKPSATSAAASSKRTKTTLGEDAVNLLRTGMNAITFQQYPKIIGKLNEMSGMGGADEEAKKLASYLAEYRGLNPKKAQAAELVGEVAPYFAAGPEMLVAKAAGRVPAIANAASTAGKAYTALRETVPFASRVLPASGKAAAEMALIEGARGASEAKDGESALSAALKSATMSQPFGRLGEVGGTYLAGKFGKSIDKMSAEASAKAQQAGEIINQWREIGQLPVTPELAKLYQRSKPLRQAVDEMAESLGLPATDPKVLQQAYSTLTADATPVFKKTILTPFLKAIDDAAAPLVKDANVRPLSEGISAYAEAMRVNRGITSGRQTGEFLRTGAGAPESVGGEVLAERLGRPYASGAERSAAAQSLIASIRNANPNIAGTLRGAAAQGLKTFLTGGPTGVGEIADLSARLGGGSFAQQMAQRTGRAFLASR